MLVNRSSVTIKCTLNFDRSRAHHTGRWTLGAFVYPLQLISMMFLLGLFGSTVFEFPAGFRLKFHHAALSIVNEIDHIIGLLNNCFRFSVDLTAAPTILD